MHRICGVVRVAAVTGVLCGLAAAGGPPAWAQTANLALTIADAPDPVAAGTNLTYTLTVANSGPSAASNVGLTDLLPVGTTFVSFAAPAGWTSFTPPVGGTGTVTATNAALATGVPQGFTLVVHGSGGGGSLVNVASVASSTADPAPGKRPSTG